jgi:integrase/recombinase XerD
MLVSELKSVARNWLLDGELGNRSQKTIKARRDVLAKLAWFLEHREASACSIEELRGFFLYLQNGHNQPGGRWGNPTQTRPLRPLTLRTYYAYLRAFFNFAVLEGKVSVSPMERIPAPRDPGDEVMPFTDREVSALLNAAKTSRSARRDRAILLLLCDTGLRASELCGVRLSDVDLHNRSLTVREGKGKKSRQVYIGKTATQALWKYLGEDEREPDDAVFLSERDGPLTYAGLRMLFRRLGTAAGVQKCHPHRFRHTFAVHFLRNGGNQFSLMRMLGHTTLTVTNRYVQLAQADIANQHRQFSPADRLQLR